MVVGRNHKIQKEDRQHLLKTFRDVLYAKTQSEYIAKKEELLSDDICLRYPHYIKHLEDGYFSRKEAWTIFFRNDEKLPTHSTNTSNYIEASFREAAKNIQRGGVPQSRGLWPQSPGPPRFSEKTMYPS